MLPNLKEKVKNKKILVFFIFTLLFTITLLFSKNTNFDSILVKSSAVINNSSSIFEIKESDSDYTIPHKKIFEYEISSDYELTQSMKNYFDKIVEFLKDNPEVSVLISAYSDAESNYEQKLFRSHKRAKYAADYLISKGIDEKRIAYSAKPTHSHEKVTKKDIINKKLPIIEIQLLR